jgi:hypothetical protein
VATASNSDEFDAPRRRRRCCGRPWTGTAPPFVPKQAQEDRLVVEGEGARERVGRGRGRD